MKCVILAAGIGKRLHPFTRNIPKPLAPVLNQPIIEHILRSVKRAGIDEVFINLFHESKQIINYFRDSCRFDGRITWHIESVLTGPAGALLAFEDALKSENEVLVLSGDGIHDFDLHQFIVAHRQSKAALSVVMQEVSDPGRYGVAKIDRYNRVVTFTEKPPLSKEAKGLVSCGIYCLDPKLIATFPRNQLFDYGQHLIPRMTAAGEDVYCYKISSYWSDIGTVATLLETNLCALSGKVKLHIPEKKTVEGIYIGENCLIHPTARLTGPLLIGRGAKIGKDGKIIGPVVIGENSVIGDNVHIQSSVLLNRSHVSNQKVIIGDLIGSC